MSIVINPFGYAALTEAVNKMLPVPTFIRNLLFKKVVTSATKTVMTDVIVGGQKIAPFVNRGEPAKVVGNLGSQAQTVEPPNIRLKKFLKPSDLFYDRGPGAPIFVPGGPAGADPIRQAQLKKIADEQKDLRDIIDRSIEMMCAKGLAGSYQIVQDNVAFKIDFQMPAANKPVLEGDAKWDVAAKCTPLKNIRLWKVQVQKLTGKIPTIAIMSSATWEAFIAADEVTKYLDKLKINIGLIASDPSVLDAGAEKKATIENVTIYTYDGVYVNEAGAQTQMIPNGYVSLVSPAADNRLQFAGIEDLDAGTTVGQFFSKDWVEKDPSGLNLLVESHPLPTFNEPGTMIYAKVY